MDNTSIITPPSGGWGAFGAQIAQRQPEAIAQLNQLYHNLFNQTIQQGCGNCYQKAFYRIQKYLYLQQQNNPSNNNDIMSKTHPTRKYLLKPDRSLQTTFGGDTLTNDNLTDDAAEKLLKAFPSLIEHFERYPVVQTVEKVVKQAIKVAGPLVETAATIAEIIAEIKK
ncbi:MAG: hypothetical protein ABIN91_06825 [Mucilaginibacter sp.]|uniref:hypothetical protein n=1 Tax=Mucilaginibacter sp. TaxID=1882438 RepID=UPI0032652EDF